MEVFFLLQILKPLTCWQHIYVFVRLRQHYKTMIMYSIYMYTFPEVKGKMFHSKGTSASVDIAWK